MNIGIVGLGLIGGSLAKAIQKYTDHRVLGFDIRPEVCSDSLADGVIDDVLKHRDLASCGLVIVALFPKETVEYIQSHAADFGADTVVMDVCGVKQAVCDPLQGLGITFIGAHPMAGREKFGYYYSDADLFAQASMILTPYPNTPESATRRISELAAVLGFARTVVTTPELHDKVIAYTSQLPHILSNAYVKSPNLHNEAGFSAGSFQDLSRVARLNEEMWVDLFSKNRENLEGELEILITHLTEYRDALKTGDDSRLKQLLREGRLLKEGHTAETGNNR